MGGGDGDPAGPWGGGDGGGDEVQTETEVEEEMEVMEMKMVWILLLGGLSNPDLAEKNGPAGEGGEKPCQLCMQAVPCTMALAPGKLELKR